MFYWVIYQADGRSDFFDSALLMSDVVIVISFS